MQGRRFKLITQATPPVVIYELGDCDFYVEYGAAGGLVGGRALSVALRRVWKLPAANLTQYQRRQAWEDAQKTFLWTTRGAFGDLKTAPTADTTYAGADARTLTGVTLNDVKFRNSERNGALEFDLEFNYPVDAQIARKLKFGPSGTEIALTTYILRWGRDGDTTVFKPVWRAAPIRIAGPPPLQVLTVTALEQAISGSTPLARRQSVEASLKNWVDKIGTENWIYLDGATPNPSYPTAFHLRAVRPSQLNWLDAMAYELEFVTGYGGTAVTPIEP